MLYSKPLQVEEIKAAGDDWEVSGYVSTFNNQDLGNDIVRPGAFKKTLKHGPKVRFLLAHDPRMVLGVPVKLTEDSKGLFGRFKISKTKLGEDTRQLVQDGAIDSFSFGYEADKYTIDEKGAIRYLDEVTMYEASLVSMPMNPEAVVTGWKAYLADLGIKDDCTLSQKVHAHAEGMKQLLDEIRGLAASHPLNEAKREELAELLATFAGLDDVRQSVQSVLTTAAPSKLVDRKLVKFQLAETRKRLATILQE